MLANIDRVCTLQTKYSLHALIPLTPLSNSVKQWLISSCFSDGGLEGLSHLPRYESMGQSQHLNSHRLPSEPQGWPPDSHQEILSIRESSLHFRVNSTETLAPGTKLFVLRHPSGIQLSCSWKLPLSSSLWLSGAQQPGVQVSPLG